MDARVKEPQERMKQLIEWSTSKITLDKRIPVRLYFRSGREILRQANIYASEGDDERAFQLYYRFVTLFLERISEHPEYRSADAGEKAYFKNQCKEVLLHLEKIKKRLLGVYSKDHQRYLEEKERQKQKETAPQNETPNQTDFISLEEIQEDTVRRFKRAQEKLSSLSLQEDHVTRVEPSAPVLSPERTKHVSFETELPKQPPSQDSQNKSLPLIDRSTKPNSVVIAGGLRRVIMSRSIGEDFLRAASSNTTQNIETCGILCGRLRQNEFAITHVIIPKQKGTSDSCLTQNEEELFLFQDQYDLTTLGWIHTHPSQSAFMSSIDLHTHFAYQVMLPEAIAVVCAPKFGDTETFSLTEYGLDFISNCTQTGFHPHPNESLLYQTSSHVHLESRTNATFIDLR